MDGGLYPTLPSPYKWEEKGRSSFLVPYLQPLILPTNEVNIDTSHSLKPITGFAII